jgi:hypothetical protein
MAASGATPFYADRLQQQMMVAVDDSRNGPSGQPASARIMKASRIATALMVRWASGLEHRTIRVDEFTELSDAKKLDVRIADDLDQCPGMWRRGPRL